MNIFLYKNPQTKIEENTKNTTLKKTTKNRELMATDRANIYYRDFNHKHIKLKESRQNFHIQMIIAKETVNRRIKSNLALTKNRKKEEKENEYKLAHKSLVQVCQLKKSFHSSKTSENESFEKKLKNKIVCKFN